MITEPFINYRMNPQQNISLDPVIIFGNDQFDCIIQSIIIANTVDNVVNVTVSISREITTGVETNIVLAESLPIDALSRIDLLSGSKLILQAGDLLFCSSDYSGNAINSFVSYVELAEQQINYVCPGGGLSGRRK